MLEATGRIKKLNKMDLYKRTGWFSRDCETLLNNLAMFGLVIVDNNELNNYLLRLEDDGK